jgi:hypothetical protein
MSRYINFDRLIFCLEDEWAWHSKKSERGLRTAMQIVKEQPIVDAVEVVRCRDCKYYQEYEPPLDDFDGWCPIHENDYDRAFYCQYGERREK